MSQERDQLPSQTLTRSFILASLCAAVLGFCLSFVRSSPGALPSVLASKTWVDRYSDFMTHPVVIIVEMALVVSAMWKIRDWRFFVCSGLLGMFLGMLVRKTLLHV